MTARPKVTLPASENKLSYHHRRRAIMRLFDVQSRSRGLITRTRLFKYTENFTAKK